MESNRCKSIYLAEIQSLCISGGIWIVHQSQTLTWQQYKTYQITKGCQIGCFLSTLAQLFLAYSIISRARSGFGRIHSFSQRSLTRICICVFVLLFFAFVYFYFCICVFVRQIKVWAGLLVLAKVSNQNCHKSQVVPPVLAGPLTNCGRWKVLKILSVIITKHTIGMKDSRHHSGLQFTVEMLINITDDLVIVFVQMWWMQWWW